MQDLGKQFTAFQKKVEASLKKFPRLAASEAQNFFLDSFRRQAWIGYNTETWPKRKPGGKRNTGRALLVDTGRLKRSIRIKKADWDSVIVGSDVPYAGVHNDGFTGTQKVGAHSRTASRRVATRYNKNGKASRAKSAQVKIRGKGHQVKAFNRKQRIPRRRFMGNSPYLNRRIDRVFTLELSKL